jgi:hypothetical protein
VAIFGNLQKVLRKIESNKNKNKMKGSPKATAKVSPMLSAPTTGQSERINLGRPVATPATGRVLGGGRKLSVAFRRDSFGVKPVDGTGRIRRKPSCV